MTLEYAFSPENTPWFYDEWSAIELLRSVRWSNGVYCPRCGSRNVREVRTERSIEVLSCRTCRYNFKTAADTYFHGSQIPICDQLKFLAAAALEPSASASSLSRLLGWKTTTVTRQLSKLGALRSGDYIAAADGYKSLSNYTSVVKFLEQPSIKIRPDLWRERLRLLLADRGQPLRRANTSPRRTVNLPAIAPPKTIGHPISQNGQDLVLPTSREYLLDETAAFELVKGLRWFNGKPVCPHCDSSFVNAIKTNNPRDLFRCVDCSYMFNSFSGTIFHAAKIEIRKYLQLFILQNALGSGLRLRDICEVLGCTKATAIRLRAKGLALNPNESFSLIEKRLAHRLLLERKNTPPIDSPFATYCESKGILIIESQFKEFVRAISRLTTR